MGDFTLKINKLFFIIILVISPVSSIFYSCITVTAQNSNLINYQPIFSEENNDGLLWKTSSGITGDITTPPVIDYADETLTNQIILIGTDKCLSKIDITLGEILWTHVTSGAVLSINPLVDITCDNILEVIISTNDQLFNNIELLDGSTGEIIWSFCPEVDVWVEGIGFSSEETVSWTTLQTDDVNGDSYPDIAITSYYTIYELNLLNGLEIWSYTTTDDIWSAALIDDIDSDSISEIAIGSQDGNLILLNGYDGTEIWNVKACETEIYEDVLLGAFYIDRNVYEVLKLGM